MNSVEIGKKYCHLEVLRDLGVVDGRRKVLCRCVCGKEVVKDFLSVRQYRTKSCGCMRHRYITYKGRTQSVSAWAREMGCDKGVLFRRLGYGWSDERTIGTPVGKRGGFRYRREYAYKGRSMTLPEWANEIGMKPNTLLHRVYHLKWPLERALTEPLNENMRRYTG